MRSGTGLRVFRLSCPLFLLTFLLTLVVACTGAGDQSGSIARPATVDAGPPPNILFIVIDDMGFNDLGANGNASVKTPNLDRLAAEGVRFTRNYVNSTCTATRAGILLGVQPESHGFRPDAIGISPEVTTLPETLRDAGYSTHHIGKWHLGFLSKLAWPTRQGFDTYFGFLAQNLLTGQRDGKWLAGHPTYRNPHLQHNEEAPIQYNGHLTDILAEHAIRKIEELATAQKPWFLNVWTFAPHGPIQPGKAYATRYPDTPAGKYLALLEHMDHSVGRILEALEKYGLDDNTVVVAVSDNGGTAKAVPSNQPLFGGKNTFFEGGVRTPLIIRWPGKLEPGSVSDDVVNYLDYFPTLAAVARTEGPPELAGLNIFDILAGEAKRQNNFYWETSNSRQHTWSILSSDGRWRLGQYFFGKAMLNDLQENPAGDQDVSDRHPEVAQKLRADYMRWRKKTRQVEYSYEKLSRSGRAKIAGNSLQRAPGYEGSTFAIALKPQQHTRAAEGTGSTQTIVAQDQMWQLTQRDATLLLDINGTQLQAPAPAPGVCSTIIVTSHFVQGLIMPAGRGSRIELYVNGTLQAEFSSRLYKKPVDTHTNPTFVGQDPQGEGHYEGVLGRPVILNEKLVQDHDNDGKIDNSISSIEKELCATLPPGNA